MRIGTTLATGVLCVAVAIALAPLAARAGEQEDQAACINDALTICSEFIPDRERVAGCLFANRDRISPACRTVLARFDQPAASPANMTTVKHPAAPRAKLAAVKHPAASRAKLTADKRPAVSRAKLIIVKQPAISRAKLIIVKHPAASRDKLTAVRQPVGPPMKLTTIR